MRQYSNITVTGMAHPLSPTTCAHKHVIFRFLRHRLSAREGGGVTGGRIYEEPVALHFSALVGHCTPHPLVKATQKSQINTVPTPTAAWTRP